MMSVSEYANDVDKSVEYIFELCKKLNINANQEDDMLSDDDIILLDNEIENMSDEDIQEDKEIESFDEDEFDDSYEEELTEVEIKNTVKNNKKTVKNKKDNYLSKKNDDFAKQKKEMYKHKEKLQSNVSIDDDSIVLYTEGMSVADFANVLNKNVAEVIKKLMSLGKIMNLNATLDFETAEILALDFGKTLKKDTTRDETNFEELEIIDDERFGC